MNVTQMETAKKWLVETAGQVLLVTGPTASGKTTLVNELLNHLRVKELSGFDKDIKTELHYIQRECTVKTVAEYAGLKCLTRPEGLIVEDVEFCSACDQNAIVGFAKLQLVPVVCIACSTKIPDISKSCFHLRLFMPSAATVASILQKEYPAKSLFELKELAYKTNCDVRQAKLCLQIGLLEGHVDKHPANPFDALSQIIPFRGFGQEQDADPILTMMVAENYVKAKGASIHCLAAAAADISTSDTLRNVDEVANIYSLISAPSKLPSLASRPSYPSVISQTATQAVNKRKLPRKVITVIDAIERRIVGTLLNGAPAKAVALEMASLDLTTIEQWEAVRVLSAIGREARKVSVAAKDSLRRCLRV